MDKRIGTRTPSGGVEKWPEQYISGRPFTKGQEAVQMNLLSAEYFCVIDPFPVVDRESALAELRAALAVKPEMQAEPAG